MAAWGREKTSGKLAGKEKDGKLQGENCGKRQWRNATGRKRGKIREN